MATSRDELIKLLAGAKQCVNGKVISMLPNRYNSRHQITADFQRVAALNDRIAEVLNEEREL